MEFWEKKFAANQRRDVVVRRELAERNVKYAIVWECTIKKMEKDSQEKEHIMGKLENFLVSAEKSVEL